MELSIWEIQQLIILDRISELNEYKNKWVEVAKFYCLLKIL